MFSSPAISPWLIYLVNVLDNVQFVTIILVIALALSLAVACMLRICVCMTDDVDFSTLYEVSRKARTPVSILAVLVAILCMVPSGKTVVTMYVLPKMVGHNGDSVRHDAALEALQHIAKKWIYDVGGKRNGNSE